MKRIRARALLVLAFLVPLTMVPTWARADDVTEHVSIIDNVFDPNVIRIPVGATVEWTNDGNSPHDVTANDGSWASGTMTPGSTSEHTFETAGAYPYYCSFHGSAGVGMTGWVLVGDASLPGAALGVGPGRETPPTSPAPTVRVPQDYPTIQEAVDHADPGGLVLISPGVYREAVVVTTPFLTIRGTDRNAVIPRWRKHAGERHPGDRGRWCFDREHDRTPLPVERILLVQRLRVPRLLPHRLR